MSVEALKEQARGHEQNEQWQKALDLYIKAMDRMSDEDAPDIGLYNCAGDLATRTGASSQAVEFYDRVLSLGYQLRGRYGAPASPLGLTQVSS
jgi:hypothetical protein